MSRGLDRILTAVNEHHDLMALLEHVLDFLECSIVHVLSAAFRTRLAFDTDEVLFEWHRSERLVEVEETGHPVDFQEVRHIDIVR